MAGGFPAPGALSAARRMSQRRLSAALDFRRECTPGWGGESGFIGSGL